MPLNWKQGFFRLAIVLSLAWSIPWAVVITNQILELRNAQRNYAYDLSELASRDEHPNAISVSAAEVDEDAKSLVEARENLTLSIKIALVGLALIPQTFGAAIWIKRGFGSR